MSPASFRQTFQRRLADYGARLQAGTASPAACYRLEGFAEAGIALGLATAAALQADVDKACGQFAVLPADSPDRVRVPLRLPVVPVYPSTR